MADERKAIGWFKKVPLLEGVSADVLVRLAQRVEIQQLRRRRVVYLPGDPGTWVYFVLAGRVKISKVTRDGKELTLALRTPGELFGELAILEGGPREEMAEVVENATVAQIERKVFQELAQNNPVLSSRMVRVLLSRQRDLANKIEYLMFKDVHSKLAELLLSLSGEYGVEHPRGTLVAMKITHQEMANLIGSTRETVSLTLSQFKRQKLVQSDGRKVIVLDRAGLQALA